MAKITTQIVKPLDNNYVQVDVSSKRMPTRSYKVPKNEADSFCSKYQDIDKKNRLSSTLIYFPLTFGCACGGYLLGHLTKAGSFLKIIASCIGAMCGDVASVKINTNIISKREQKLLNDYKAEEIKQEKISDII